jgi:hypothetical protein
MGTGVPHGPIPDVLFPRTLAYITPNPRVNEEMNEGVRDQIVGRLGSLGSCLRVRLDLTKNRTWSTLT